MFKLVVLRYVREDINESYQFIMISMGKAGTAARLLLTFENCLHLVITFKNKHHEKGTCLHRVHLVPFYFL